MKTINIAVIVVVSILAIGITLITIIAQQELAETKAEEQKIKEQTEAVVKHTAFCNNWFNNIEHKRIIMEQDFVKALLADYDQINADISAYNRECAY